MADIKLFGNINKEGQCHIDNNKSIINILKQDAMGMINEENLELAQIGGPLGVFVAGKQLNNSLNEYLKDAEMSTIMFLNNKFCPVDLSRFMIRYLKRERGVVNDELNTLDSLIEEISSGKVRKYTYEELLSELEQKSADAIVAKVKRNINYLINRYESIFKEHVNKKRCSASVCNRLYSAQCINTCPAQLNIPGYVALMNEERNEDAYRLMRQSNPLSFVCGKVCARPCESKCRRGEIEKTVGVRALKHYAATMALENKGFVEDKLPENGKKIGIIGSGPAGLSAAYYLARSGYKVDIYEKYPVVGGMLAVGIPAYRLSQQSINEEVKLIENLGVKIHTNTEVGKDITFDKIKSSHDGVIIATGCHKANKFSDNIVNLEAAIDFLREVKLENRKNVGKQVVVIGGGDVAMDAARTALRLGAENVVVASLESYLQMPANDEEKEEAQKEGIKLYNGYGTKQILEKNNKAYSIVLKKCVSLFNLDNMFSPEYNEDETIELKCDQIILAIGQKSDISYLNGAVELDANGRIKVNEEQMTSEKGIYIAGDLVKPGNAIKAIAEGKSAANALDSYLGGKGLYIGEEIEIPEPQILYSIWDTKNQDEKVTLFEKGCKDPFKENRSVLTKEEVKCEALRCMRCDRNSRQ